MLLTDTCQQFVLPLLFINKMMDQNNLDKIIERSLEIRTNITSWKFNKMEASGHWSKMLWRILLMPDWWAEM